MAIIDQNQQEAEKNAKEIILYKLHPELIAAKLTLVHVLKGLCANDKLMQEVYESSGDSSTTIIWYLRQVIKYLEVIIAINQEVLNALAGKMPT